MNGVDEPTAYMETHRVKSGIYLERNASDPTAPHFSIRTGGSIISLSSHNGRPQFSISDSAHSGAASIQRILTPGDPRALSMQLSRGARSGLNSGEDQRRSLLCGVLGVSRMRYGVLDTNLSRKTRMLRFASNQLKKYESEICFSGHQDGG